MFDKTKIEPLRGQKVGFKMRVFGPHFMDQLIRKIDITVMRRSLTVKFVTFQKTTHFDFEIQEILCIGLPSKNEHPIKMS